MTRSGLIWTALIVVGLSGPALAQPSSIEREEAAREREESRREREQERPRIATGGTGSACADISDLDRRRADGIGHCRHTAAY